MQEKEKKLFRGYKSASKTIEFIIATEVSCLISNTLTTSLVEIKENVSGRFKRSQAVEFGIGFLLWLFRINEY